MIITSNIAKECAECPHIIGTESHVLHNVAYYCRCECGRVLDDAHPLSPCVLEDDCILYGASEDDDLWCYIDEDSIVSGNRCLQLRAWLYKMDKLKKGLPIEEVL